jgi:hypothetical protein
MKSENIWELLIPSCLKLSDTRKFHQRTAFPNPSGIDLLLLMVLEYFRKCAYEDTCN